MSDPLNSLGDSPTGAPGDEGIVSLSDVLTARQRKRFRAGDVLCGRYKILGELGQGGMGLVFRCLDEVGGIEVAVKMLPPEVSRDTSEMEEVRENFRIVEKLHHPNIVAVKTLERDPVSGEYLLVMELAEGVNLRQWRKKGEGGRRTPEEVLPVVRQVAAALDYAHERKIIHRDIKPANIMVGPDGAVKLLDFGLAAQIHTSFSRVSQVKYGTSGTGPYMAPEQWEGEEQDAATDQYALAATIYELLAGRCPFESAEMLVLRNAVLHSQPKAIPGLPAMVMNAVSRALAKSREARFPNCAAFVEALAGKRVEPQRAQGVRRGNEGNRKRAMPVIALALGLAAALGIGWWGWTTMQERSASQARQVVMAGEQAARSAELARQAEDALNRGDLDAAGRAVAELENVDPGRARKLRDEISGRVNKGNAAAAYGEAKRRHDDDLPGWEKDPEGLSALIQEFKSAWNAGELAQRDNDWSLVFEQYQRVQEVGRRIDAVTVERGATRSARTKAEQARGQAEDNRAATDAMAVWAEAEQARTGAAAQYGRAEYAGARAGYEEAEKKYAQAQQRAVAVQGYGAARGEYERERSAADVELLKTYGGPAWAEASRLSGQAELMGDEPEQGRQLYAQALAKLKEANAAAPKAKAAEDLAAALAKAQDAARREAWPEVLASANAALALDAANATAQQLKRQAESKLEPTLTITATADGQSVSATVTDGRNTYETGKPIRLRKGAGYELTVTYASAGKRWKPAKVSGTADWSGPEARAVELEEARGPVEGQNWVSPATGMEFVWIPALKMWVGKYEVTNGEYRKMNPGHNSGDYEGRSLNGDRQPVVRVDFGDAKAFSDEMTRRDAAVLGGAKYRLPRENEWMKFAQCGDGRKFPWGNNWPPVSGQAGNYAGQETTVFSGWNQVEGGYRDGYEVSCDVEKSWMNPWGLYGVGGNVWEVCAADGNPSAFGAWRGASWGDFNRDDLACELRYVNVGRLSDYGFRLVLSP